MTSRIREAQDALQVDLRCNDCRAIFPEADAVDDELCPECGCDSLFEHTGFHVNEYGESIPHVITGVPAELNVVEEAIEAWRL